MNELAIKMLMGNRSSFIGIVFGIFLATLLIGQQSAIFLGLISRSYRLVTDIPAPTIWVADPATESDVRVRALPEGYLDIVRSVPGVEWAAPLYLSELPLVTQSGVFEICILIGIDDATLIGAPVHMVEGHARDLRKDRGIIVDINSAKNELAKKLPDGTTIPLEVGDEIEINNRRAVVVGLCKITPGFYPQPIIYTSSSEFKAFSPASQLDFILVKNMEQYSVSEVQQRINVNHDMNAMTSDEFKWAIIQSFLRTGILINFGLSLALGIVIGLSIAGQIFYRLTMENLPYYALIKAVGGTNRMILRMITLQALVSGAFGYLLGLIVTLLWGEAIRNTTLAFLFPWELVLFTAVVIGLICAASAALSIRKVFHADPKILMGT